MLYSIFFGKPVAFAAMIHLMSEKRDWGTAFSNSLLMAIYDLAWRSRNHPTTNHKITINTIPFESIV